VKIVDKFSKGQSNFETVIASQKRVFDNAKLGFNPHNKKILVLKPFSSLLKKQPIELSKQPVVSYFYCMKKGHSVRFCRVKKFFVPKGILKWVPKVPINSIGPKFIRRPNLYS